MWCSKEVWPPLHYTQALVLPALFAFTPRARDLSSLLLFPPPCPTNHLDQSQKTLDVVSIKFGTMGFDKSSLNTNLHV